MNRPPRIVPPHGSDELEYSVWCVVCRIAVSAPTADEARTEWNRHKRNVHGLAPNQLVRPHPRP